MFRTQTLAELALADIDQLLNKFDPGGQIESALPLLHHHRRTLVQLHEALVCSTNETLQDRDCECWADDLVVTYEQLHGQAPHAVVYRKMEELRKSAGRSWPKHAEELIRQTLQAHCAESSQYRGGPDLFRMIRPGLWGLKNN